MSQLSLDELRNIATVLGISSEGKSAEDLSALIKGVAQKPPTPSPSFIDPNALSKHFEEGRFTDCTIRVKIKDASTDVAPTRRAKRRRTGRSKGTETEGPADEEEGVQLIKAHALVLASRSAYFERAMGGEWRESQDRSFEVEVADETEYVTFRRLIKLCYGTTFIKEGDRDLDVSELLRLIHVANAFECMDAVKQCTVALQGGKLHWEGAVQCLELTDMLKGVEGMAELAKKAGDVLAKEVGPVHELFTPAKQGEDGGDVLYELKLSEKVKSISPAVFESLISSDSLQLKTENEAFWLLLAWVEARSEESEKGKQALFTSMAKHLRFHVMDPGYILMVVSEHPRIISAGLQGTVFRESLGYATLARRTPTQVANFQRISEIKLSLSRVPSGKVGWSKDVTFTAADIAEASKDSYCLKTVGLVAGIPWKMQLDRDDDDDVKVGTAPDALLGYQAPNPNMGGGIFFSYRLEIGGPRSRIYNSYGYGDTELWTDGTLWSESLGAWEEVFAEGSDLLRDGQLDVKVTITLCNDQPRKTD